MGNGAAGVIELSDVVLASGAIVSGVVMDENGRPDYLAVVTAIPDGQTTRRALIRPAATDGEGRYRLSGLGAGRWRIAVTQRRGRMARSVISTDTQTIDLSAGERRQVHFRNP